VQPVYDLLGWNTYSRHEKSSLLLNDHINEFRELSLGVVVIRLSRTAANLRKKKVYTKPKRLKHKKKRVKLAVLKYYKVDENGKITRLRRECPKAECGAGVFMASHHDRQYCGKCGLTYVFNKKTEA